MKRTWMIIGVICWLIPKGLAQGEYELGILPKVNMNYSIDKVWGLNLSAESRFGVGEGTFGEGIENDFSYILTDIAAVLSHRVALRGKIAVGYLIRFEDGLFIHRINQMYSTVTKYEALKIGHRIVSDQTFEADEPVSFRLRYRASAEIPLQGQTANNREFYVKLNNEYLGIFESGTSDLEIRLVGVFGYKLKDKNKLEWGIDNRWKDITSENRAFQGWLVLGWYYSI